MSAIEAFRAIEIPMLGINTFVIALGWLSIYGVFARSSTHHRCMDDVVQNRFNMRTNEVCSYAKIPPSTRKAPYEYSSPCFVCHSTDR